MILTTKTMKRGTFGSNALCGAHERCDTSLAVTAKIVGITSTRTRSFNMMITHRERVIPSTSTRSPIWRRSKNLSVSYSFGVGHLQSCAPQYNWSKSSKMYSKKSRSKAAWSNLNTPLITMKWSARRTQHALFCLTTSTSAAGTYGLAFFWSIPVSSCRWE